MKDEGFGGKYSWDRLKMKRTRKWEAHGEEEKHENRKDKPYKLKLSIYTDDFCCSDHFYVFLKLYGCSDIFCRFSENKKRGHT